MKKLRQIIEELAGDAADQPDSESMSECPTQERLMQLLRGELARGRVPGGRGPRRNLRGLPGGARAAGRGARGGRVASARARTTRPAA